MSLQKSNGSSRRGWFFALILRFKGGETGNAIVVGFMADVSLVGTSLAALFLKHR